MPGRYTSLAVWVVKRGREEEFVSAWERLASQSRAAFEEAGATRLLQDTLERNRFYSFGDWETLEAIEAVRDHPELQDAAARLAELVDRHELHALELRAVQS